MSEIITKQEIGKDFNQYQIDGFKREIAELIHKYKGCGLMAPEICYIAHGVLEELSEKAKEQIKLFGRGGDLDQTLEKADKLLKQLQSK